MNHDKTWAALLRGINVGGKHKIPMTDLRGIFQKLGCSDVGSYIQSGNIVFNTDKNLADQIPVLVPGAIEQQCGFRADVLVRSYREMCDIISQNPFLKEHARISQFHVVFLDIIPDKEKIEELDPDLSPPDRFLVQGREIFLDCPDGLARTKYTNAWFDKKLAATSSMRNWKTVNNIVSLMEKNLPTHNR